MMNVTLNFLDILLISLAVQGGILSCILFIKSKKIKSNRWIGGFIFVIAQTTVIMELFRSDLTWRYPMLLVYTPVLKLLLGPLIYFYARSLIYGDHKVSLNNCLNFLPVLLDMRPQFVQLLYSSGVLSIPVVTNWYTSMQMQQFLFRYNILFDLPTLFSLVIYSGLSYRETTDALRNMQINEYKRSDLQWLKTFLYLVAGLIGNFGVSLIFTALSSWNNYFLYLPAIGFVYWLGMRLLIRQGKMLPEDVSTFNKPPVKTYFTDHEAKKYQQWIVEIMETDQLYLNPSLKLEHMAEKLDIPEKQVSSLLNQHIGQNFNDFVNEYRVKAVTKQLNGPMAKKYTIATIAFDCGFNSLATFQRCFKQFTGITPSRYQNELKKNLVATKTDHDQ